MLRYSSVFSMLLNFWNVHSLNHSLFRSLMHYIFNTMSINVSRLNDFYVNHSIYFLFVISRRAKIRAYLFTYSTDNLFSFNYVRHAFRTRCDEIRGRVLPAKFDVNSRAPFQHRRSGFIISWILYDVYYITFQFSHRRWHVAIIPDRSCKIGVVTRVRHTAVRYR